MTEGHWASDLRACVCSWCLLAIGCSLATFVLLCASRYKSLCVQDALPHSQTPHQSRGGFPMPPRHSLAQDALALLGNQRERREQRGGQVLLRLRLGGRGGGRLRVCGLALHHLSCLLCYRPLLWGQSQLQASVPIDDASRSAAMAAAAVGPTRVYSGAHATQGAAMDLAGCACEVGVAPARRYTCSPRLQGRVRRRRERLW